MLIGRELELPLPIRKIRLEAAVVILWNLFMSFKAQESHCIFPMGTLTTILKS
jgi:hypothetical protein